MRLALALFVSFAAVSASAQTVRSSRSPECVLRAVAFAMNVNIDPAKPLPEIRYASDTPIAEFQDAMEPQWGFRPDVVINAYVPAIEKIFLIDDAQYYAKFGRAVDDSLAHELAHYVQVRYKGISLETFTDLEESEAVRIQTWFRERYVHGSPEPGLPDCR